MLPQESQVAMLDLKSRQSWCDPRKSGLEENEGPAFGRVPAPWQISLQHLIMSK